MPTLASVERPPPLPAAPHHTIRLCVGAPMA